MTYAVAMEKAVEGFRGLHASKVVDSKTSLEEWEKVYRGFMEKHQLSIYDAQHDKMNILES